MQNQNTGTVRSTCTYDTSTTNNPKRGKRGSCKKNEKELWQSMSRRQQNTINRGESGRAQQVRNRAENRTYVRRSTAINIRSKATPVEHKPTCYQ